MPVLKPGTQIQDGPIFALGANQDLLVRKGVTLASFESIAVQAVSPDHDITIRGTVSGVVGVLLGEIDTHTGLTLTVEKGGLLGSFTNTAGVALQVYGSGARISNAGTIAGPVGLQIFATVDGTSRVVNSGLILGDDYAIFRADTGTQKCVLLNTGTITGAYSYTVTSLAVDWLTNRGRMNGDVSLGGGNDRFDGRGGKVYGDVDLSAGDDFCQFNRLGSVSEGYYGGTGEDVISFAASKGITLVLDQASGVIGFEVIIGSATGNDRIEATSGKDALRGLGGRDELRAASDPGLNGSSLDGGAGRDRLLGSFGVDTFIYHKPSEGGDRIRDYTPNVVIGDRLMIDASGFGLGLPDGPLAAGRFHAGGTNKAADKGDRFIFRNGDATLWFDKDGKGGAGPVLIADFDNGVTLTRTDIELF